MEEICFIESEHSLDRDIFFYTNKMRPNEPKLFKICSSCYPAWDVWVEKDDEGKKRSRVFPDNRKSEALALCEGNNNPSPIRLFKALTWDDNLEDVSIIQIFYFKTKGLLVQLGEIVRELGEKNIYLGSVKFSLTKIVDGKSTIYHLSLVKAPNSTKKLLIEDFTAEERVLIDSNDWDIENYIANGKL